MSMLTGEKRILAQASNMKKATEQASAKNGCNVTV